VLDLQLPQTVTETMLVAIDRHVDGDVATEWNMLQPKQVLGVWNAIRALPGSERPHKVRHLTLNREELAEEIGVIPADVSRMMGTLERIGVVFRERVKVAGMPGRGIARYRINLHVAWNGDTNLRKTRAEQIPLPLTVVEGGKEA
jgi:hypothetical protein